MENIQFTKKDLFKMPQGYCLAHCISADFALGAGIALDFDLRYKMRKRLFRGYGENEANVGDVLKIDNVYNLVTKQRAFEKPTYEDFQMTINNFVHILELDGVEKVAIPKLGAGLDGLNWNIVLALLKDAFRESEISVTICFLEDDPDCPDDIQKLTYIPD